MAIASRTTKRIPAIVQIHIIPCIMRASDPPILFLMPVSSAMPESAVAEAVMASKMMSVVNSTNEEPAGRIGRIASVVAVMVITAR